MPFQGPDGQTALCFLFFLCDFCCNSGEDWGLETFWLFMVPQGSIKSNKSPDLRVQDSMFLPQGNNLYLNSFLYASKRGVVKLHKGEAAKFRLFIKQFNLPGRQERVNQYDEGLLLSFVIENIKYPPWKSVDWVHNSHIIMLPFWVCHGNIFFCPLFGNCSFSKLHDSFHNLPLALSRQSQHTSFEELVYETGQSHRLWTCFRLVPWRQSEMEFCACEFNQGTLGNNTCKELGEENWAEGEDPMGNSLQSPQLGPGG